MKKSLVIERKQMNKILTELSFNTLSSLHNIHRLPQTQSKSFVAVDRLFRKKKNVSFDLPLPLTQHQNYRNMSKVQRWQKANRTHKPKPKDKLTYLSPA